MYNGQDGVITDKNGLIYMRARYYSPELRRFVNADIVAGSLDNSVTLNRFAYVNGNPVSLIDPFGLSASDGRGNSTIPQEPFLLVLYDPNNFSKQAEDESKYLMSEYQYDQVITIPVVNKEDFKNAWNEYATSADGVSLIFHGSPEHIWVGENFTKTEVGSLEKANLNFLRLLSCNGGHKNVPDNIADAFKSNHNIATLYAMDGSISYYYRLWYDFGEFDYSNYAPRLSFNQSSYYKNAREIKMYYDKGYIAVPRLPSRMYAIE